jgi:hypothetical protein
MSTVPSALPASSPHTSPLFDLARQIDARLRTRATSRRRSYALDALDLAECKRLDLHRLLGYSSITAYARAVNGFGASKTSDLLRIAEKSERLPKIRRAFLAGELDWCAAREIVDKATPEDEDEWLEKARQLSVAELRACAREEAPVYGRGYKFDQQELGWVEDAVAGVRREIGPVAPGKALAEVCRRACAGEAGGVGGPRHRFVIYVCAECRNATRQTSEGELPVSVEEIERIEHDAEVLDIRKGPARVARAVPPTISNYVRARDKGRCAVPGCHKPGAHFHHDEGRRNGHDPETGFSLCHSHHDARHRGYLRIEGSAPDAHFFLADGTCLGRAGDEERADSISLGEEPAPRSVSGPEQAGGEPSPAATSPGDAAASAPPPAEALPGAAPLLAPEISHALAGPNPVDDAVKALRKLGIDARGAERAVRSVLQLHPGRSWEAGELARAALAGPLPPARAS